MAEEKVKEKVAAPAKAPAKEAPKKAVPSEPKKAAPAEAKKAPAKDADKKPAKEAPKTFSAYADTEADRSSISVPLMSIEAKEVRKVHLPKVFEEPVRSDLIGRAVQAARANRRQPYGAPAEGV